MGLAQVTTVNVTSNVSSVSLTGINTDDVYMVSCNNVFFDSNDDMRIRWTVSGTNDSSSNYQYSHKAQYADAGFGNTGTTGANALDINQGTGTSGNNSINLIMHLFNFNNASGYSYCTYENVHRNTSQSRTGVFNGSGVLQENQATDGVYFYLNSGNNFASGTFTLYKVVGE